MRSSCDSPGRSEGANIFVEMLGQFSGHPRTFSENYRLVLFRIIVSFEEMSEILIQRLVLVVFIKKQIDSKFARDQYSGPATRTPRPCYVGFVEL